MSTSAPRRGLRTPTPLAAVVLLLVLGVAAVPDEASAQQRSGFQPEDHYRLVRIDDVEVSPGGGLVVFTVTRVLEDQNRRRSEIWLRQLRDAEPVGEPIRLTTPGRDSYAPRWSPDGMLLSFVSERKDDPDPHWFLRVGGVGGEAFHVDGVRGRPVWSPDGRWIAYRAPAGDAVAAGRDGDDGRARSGSAPGRVTEAVESDRFGGRVVTGLRTRDGGAGFRDAPAGPLFVVAADGGEPRQVTDGERQVREFAWGGDGEWIYYSAGPLPDPPPEPGAGADLWRVSRDGGEVHRITAGPGSDRSPAVSPAGDRVAYLHRPAPGAQAEIHVTELGRNGAVASPPTSLTAGFDRSAGPPQWLDDETVGFAARDAGSRHLYRVSLDRGRVEQVTAGDRRHERFSFSRDGSVMAYVASAPTSPPELHVARGDGTVETRVTAFNDAWLEDRILSPARRLTWLAEDSTRIEGWVVPPVEGAGGPLEGTGASGDSPLVLLLHEEPHGSWGHQFRPEVQALAAAGFYVLCANPRGSRGYGRAFAEANRREWGLAEKNDYLAGIEAVRAEFPDVAPGRVGVAGHGYGGFLVAWLTATSDRFAAAVASAPVVNWESWYGSSAERGLLEREFGAPPWAERSVYRRLSPLSYVENVTAPTLLLLPGRSRWSPATEGEQWFAALRRRNVPVEMVRYPDAYEDLSTSGEPWQVVDRLTRVRGWLRHWLVETPLESRVSGIGADDGSR